jgi:D-alanyl-D-alanine carboxypeptidase (penicillin-binding protein 5/6)
VALAGLGAALFLVLGTAGPAFAETDSPEPPPTSPNSDTGPPPVSSSDTTPGTDTTPSSHAAAANRRVPTGHAARPGASGHPARPAAKAPAAHKPSPAHSAPSVSDANCTVAAAPPPAIDASETPRAGTLAPPPLPVPAQPVGGPRMGECGNVLPPGGPPAPSVEDSVSWIIADLDSGAVLAARSPHARERPASCLKILTSLVIMSKLDMNTQVQGTEADADAPGSRVGVGPGGTYTVHQLFTGLILNSGNDAANALARQLGGVPATLRDMSQTAVAMGALDTRPTSPSGLDAPGMSTSAYDLALFYRQAIKQPVFAEISRTRLFDWPGRGDLPGFQISNDNHMLTEYPGTFGGKTGFTDDARHTRITAAERHGRRLVVVQMRGETHPVPMDTQAARLLDYGFALPADTPPVGQLVTEAPLAPGTDGAAGEDSAATLAAGSTPTGQPAENPRAALAVIGGGALLGALLSVLVARRRPPGRHSTAATRSDLPD